jgi:hypothetical protein
MIFAGCSAEPAYRSNFHWNPDAKVNVPLRIVFEDGLGDGFRLASLHVVLDEATIYEKKLDPETEPADARPKSMDLFSGQGFATDHALRVEAVYRGNGYGVFSYLKGYQFPVKGEHAFTAQGPSFEVHAIAFENPNVPLEERPQLRFIDAAVAR